MEALLLGIYAFFVWLIFIKFKWLPHAMKLRRGGFFQLFVAHVVASFRGAENLPAVSLGNLLGQEFHAALRARLDDRLVP